MSAPPSLENSFFNCCTKQTFSAVMAEANAFAALCMTVMVLVLTAVFLPLEFLIFREKPGNLVRRLSEAAMAADNVQEAVKEKIEG